jgi:hypothetical protein
MDIKFCHDFLNFLADKEKGGMVPHPEIDTALHSASISLFNEYKAVYDSSQDARDALSPFLKKEQYNTLPEWELPENCAFVLNCAPLIYDNALQKTIYGVARIVSETELPARLNSQVRPVTASKPVAAMEMGDRKQKIVWYPTANYSGFIWFLKFPSAPVYAFKMSGRTEVFLHGNSQYFEWNETDVNRIVFRAASILGLTIDDRDLIQFGMAKKQENS